MSSSAITRHEHELAAFAEWEWNCTQLAAFVRKRGHYNLGEHPLGEWLRRQQNAAVAGRLSEERQQRLAVLGISFEPQDGAWDAMLRRLRQCLKRQRVPLKKSREQWLPDAPDEDLAAWLGEQRQIHSQGLLRADRLRRLQPLKVIGNSRKYQEKENKPLKSDVSWETRHSELCDFSSQFGHCDVPKAYAPNPPLSNWVSMQREKQKRG
ncbi:MAG: helicase associated domain-containing protein, partial [Prosthecobacter sp.]|nr:helicase associated domain-containing protein [Prosthecobacter sp.]